MTTRHEDLHTDVLDRLLVANADPLAAFERSQLSTCEVCREDLEAMLDTEGALAHLGGEVRQTRALAESLGKPDDRERVLRLLESHPATVHARAVSPKWWWLAAAIPLAVGLWSIRPQAASEPSPLLGSTQKANGSPEGQVATWGSFEWDLELPVGGTFEVRIFDAAAAPDDDPLAQVTQWREPRWTPETSVLRALPNRIGWEVDSFGADGSHHDSASFEAWLSPR
jgi:hypothetical protein